MTGRIRYTASHWGLNEVTSDSAGTVSLSPFRADPDPSAIGLDRLSDGVQSLRVRRPAVRTGWLRGEAGAGRGGGRDTFTEIGWDEALDLVSGEIARVRADHGNSALFAGSYGWSSAGRFHHAQSQIHRIFNVLGGYSSSVDSYSLGAGQVIMPYVAGSVHDLMGGASSWDVLAEHCSLFVSFGGAPRKNAQVSPGGAGRHRLQDSLRRLADSGVRMINISPVRDDFIAPGVEWMPIRPNTDTALMLALAWCVRQDLRFERATVERLATGFDKFEAYLLGADDGLPKSPAWAEGLTGLAARDIEALADSMMRSRTMLNISWSLQRAAHGEQPYWMLVTLAAMLGQIGLPGGGFGIGYGAVNLIGTSHMRLPGPTFPQGRNPVSDFIPVARITDMLERPGAAFTYKGKTHQYPDARLIYWAGGNPFHHHQDLNRLARAWDRPETVIVHEQYWNATARRADIILPATTSLERDDIGFAAGEGYMVAMHRVVPPLAEARDDFAIFADLAERMGVRDAFTEGLDTHGWLERIYEASARLLGQLGTEIPSFADFWSEGIIDFTQHDAPIYSLAAFRSDPDANPLATPSGRIEIFSEQIHGFDLPDCPGHPVWREPFEWLGHDLADRFPLHLLSDQPARRLHSQLDHSAYSRAGKVHGREPVYLSPGDAAQRGLGDGDIVEIFNDRGRCIAAARVSDAIMPGVARLATGAWFDSEDGLEKHGNPNAVTLDAPASSLSQGCSAQTCLVEIRKAESPPAVSAFDLPRFVERPEPAIRP